MIHPSTELGFINQEIGHGVFATEFIPRGTITWGLDKLDQVLQPQEVAALLPICRENFEKYAYIDPSGNYVLCWDLGRYMNHSCSPTTRGMGYGFDIAVRDIHLGEELTYDYATLNVTNNFQCCCNSANCRGIIRPDDILHYWQTWDIEYAEAFALITKVTQPLWSIAIEENQHDKILIEAMLNQTVKLPSFLDYRLHEDDQCIVQLERNDSSLNLLLLRGLLAISQGINSLAGK